MLLNLEIKNAALIERVGLEINNGLTVLTGETGAGKSVIIDSINMILGARCDKGLVRFGEKKAVVQAVFEVNDKELLEEYGIDSEEDFAVITREISSEGKSICRINGTIVLQSALREIAGNFINIHGQHDNQALLTPSEHINFLDSYAKAEKLLADYLESYAKMKEIKEKIQMLEMDEAEKIRKIDLLSYQVEELEKAKLKPGEKEELSEQKVLVGNGEKISISLNSAYESLYNVENSAYELISNAAAGLAKISDFDKRFEEIYQRINEILYNVEDISHEIYALSGEIEYDEQMLNDIEARLDCILKLERKYGGSEEAALAFLENAKSELEKITDCEAEKNRLSKELEAVMKELLKKADKLTEARKKAAEKLSWEIEKELSELDMPKARFKVSVTSLDDYSKNGLDKVEFLISPNFGEPEKPLDKIASGGELSRVMLAIKGILADSDNVDTLIFDEIDTGVSGSAAQKIAKKLAALAKKKQVICVSHQPQLAAAADNHYKIVKTESKERTVTTARLLEGGERIEEIARITDGDNITKTSLEHAGQLLMQYGKEQI